MSKYRMESVMDRTNETNAARPPAPAPQRPAFSFGRMLVLAQRRFRARERQQMPLATQI